jgi:hypothetical protein
VLDNDAADHGSRARISARFFSNHGVVNYAAQVGHHDPYVLCLDLGLDVHLSAFMIIVVVNFFETRRYRCRHS